jgi:hypothetical protein
MADQHGYRRLEQLEEFTAQYEAIVARHSSTVITPVLDGIFWGISKNPRAYERTKGKLRSVKSKSLGLTIPRFWLLFEIQNEGQEDEYILLCWIEEISETEQIMGT